MALSAEDSALLARLADPESPAATLAPDQAERLTAAAEAHGVGPILRRKLGRRAADPARETRDVLRIGQSLRLARKAETVGAALKAAGFAFSAVKGPVFARRLYAHAADRPFTDIDLLLRPEDLEPAGAVMREAGFRLHAKPMMDNARRDLEYKWSLVGDDTVFFELQGDLVHYPRLRRRASFGLAALLRFGAGDPEAPEALLATAIVHGTLSHKLHKLQMLVDVLQAARRLPEASAEGFVRQAQDSGLALEAALALNLAGAVFADPAVSALAARFPESGLLRLGRRLVTPEAALKAAEARKGASWARRKGFRMLQYLA